MLNKFDDRAIPCLFSRSIDSLVHNYVIKEKGYEMPTTFAAAFFASTVSSKESCGACRDATLKLNKHLKKNISEKDDYDKSLSSKKV